MQIRNPAVAGAFYPFDSSELKSTIENFLNQANISEKNVVGIVVPHAGYVYCGRTAAFAYKSIKKNFDTVIVLGPNHFGLGLGISTYSGMWKTPLGNINTDDEFINELIKNKIIIVDNKAHLREHSIEVQLPWLQHRFKDFRFIPISINPIYFDIENSKKIGEAIADTIKKLKRKTLIVASSDFTHYGSAYNNIPFRGTTSQILKRIKEMDMEAVDCITKIMPERFLELCDEKRLSICGYGAIGSMLFAAKILGAKKGELMNYTTSFDHTKDTSAIVAYSGICIY